jgi:hypothetical protein
VKNPACKAGFYLKINWKYRKIIPDIFLTALHQSAHIKRYGPDKEALNEIKINGSIMFDHYPVGFFSISPDIIDIKGKFSG